MPNKIIISIVFVIKLIALVNSNYLNLETGYRKPLLERNNILNKGVWKRYKHKGDAEGKIDNFIFRPTSLEVDNLLQGDYNTFDSPIVHNYVERSRRSIKVEKPKLIKKRVQNCNSQNCIPNNASDKFLDYSQLISKLKPTSVFNDYPYEIAVLLDNTRKQIERARNITKMLKAKELKNTSNSAKNTTSVNIETLPKNKDLKDVYNATSNINATYKHKRGMTDEIDNLEVKTNFIKNINKTVDHTVINRDAFDNEETAWHHNVPVNNPRYSIIPQNVELVKSKPITERGLLKVLSILTKTFKKIMRQHNNIKEVNRKMQNIHKNFVINSEALTEKFKDFDIKYLFLMKLNENIQVLENKFKIRENYFKIKEDGLARTLIAFENQQKKFLDQQKQFHNIQKLMLAQNENINAKQILISKTQSEISLRQNNFARILKKANQIYIDKHPTTTKIIPVTVKISNKTEEKEVTHTSTPPALQDTESVKFNLFSIPSISRLENQDQELLKEKDEPVDDLVYKYYFNNTFIANLMKNKILADFAAAEDNAETKNVKSKRNDVSKIQTTMLLPVSQVGGVVEGFTGQNEKRQRRWINQHSIRKSRRRNRGKGTNTNYYTDNNSGDNLMEIPTNHICPKGLNEFDTSKSKPFLVMATSFCKGIGQDINKQVLDWCIEKALRRLQNIDTKLPSELVHETKHNFKPQIVENEGVTKNLLSTTDDERKVSTSTTVPSQPTVPSSETTVIVSSQSYLPLGTTSQTQNLNLFFPDNDQLESNLKKYELIPDLEGNVYYDRSLHESDIVADKDSSGFSDIIQLESNSRIQVDPVTFDLQAKKRAFMRRYNEMKKLTGMA